MTYSWRNKMTGITVENTFNAFKADKDQFGDQAKYVRSEKEFRSKFRG